MIFLSIGSNLGDRAAYLSFAREQLRASSVSILAESPIFVTPPWGNENQPGYLNQVLKIAFKDGPFQLLVLIREIENKAGRQRIEKWGARTLDIDIIEYDRMVIDDPVLTLPHPFYTQRLFVLVPLACIEPTWVPAGSEKTVLDRIGEFSDEERDAVVETDKSGVE